MGLEQAVSEIRQDAVYTLLASDGRELEVRVLNLAGGLVGYRNLETGALYSSPVAEFQAALSTRPLSARELADRIEATVVHLDEVTRDTDDRITLTVASMVTGALLALAQELRRGQ